MNSEKDKPEFLYKFRCWTNGYQHATLAYRALFFASIMKFNDPWDCRIPLRYDKMEHSERFKFFYQLRREHSPQESERDSQLEAERLAQVMSNRENAITYAKESEALISSYYGVLSFAGTNQNSLLWSHYADGHKGFCLEFRRDTLEKDFERYEKKLDKAILYLKVKYESLYPEIVPTNDSNDESMFKRFKYKSSDWEYEDEYRYVLHYKADFILHYSPDALNKIILGCEMSEEHRRKIIDIVNSRFPNCEIAQAERQFDRFDLSFEAITK